MRVLVCGSRTFEARVPLFTLLDGLDSRNLTIVEGGARGADSLAREWAKCASVEVRTVPADWERYGRRAGLVRNRAMLAEHKPHLVVAFVDKPLETSTGTAHMVTIARQAGVPTWVVEVLP